MGLAGAPASGKSTLAEALARAVPRACVVPMDGFHLDNAILSTRGLLARKGAPQTFDAAGFAHLMARLRREEDVIYPLFDRSLDRAIAGAGHVSHEVETVVVEGNYLLFDSPVWRDLIGLWDLSINLTVCEETLRTRLIERWLDYGYTPDEARRKAEENDLPNATLVQEASLKADLSIAAVEGLVL